MLDERLRLMALETAKKYLGDVEEKPESTLIKEMEECGYELARTGSGKDANALFIAVAELTKSAICNGTGSVQH